MSTVYEELIALFDQYENLFAVRVAYIAVPAHQDSVTPAVWSVRNGSIDDLKGIIQALLERKTPGLTRALHRALISEGNQGNRLLIEVVPGNSTSTRDGETVVSLDTKQLDELKLLFDLKAGESHWHTECGVESISFSHSLDAALKNAFQDQLARTKETDEDGIVRKTIEDHQKIATEKGLHMRVAGLPIRTTWARVESENAFKSVWIVMIGDGEKVPTIDQAFQWLQQKDLTIDGYVPFWEADDADHAFTYAAQHLDHLDIYKSDKYKSDKARFENETRLNEISRDVLGKYKDVAKYCICKVMPPEIKWSSKAIEHLLNDTNLYMPFAKCLATHGKRIWLPLARLWTMVPVAQNDLDRSCLWPYAACVPASPMIKFLKHINQQQKDLAIRITDIHMRTNAAGTQYDALEICCESAILSDSKSMDGLIPEVAKTNPENARLTTQLAPTIRWAQEHLANNFSFSVEGRAKLWLRFSVEMLS